MIPSRRNLEKGIYSLIHDTLSTISFSFDHPLLEEDISRAATSLAAYLNHYISRNRRRSKTPLNARHLSFQSVRTYNPKEEKFDKDRRRTSKGEKEWYYLELCEFANSHPNDDKPQILAERDLRKDKADILDAFIEMVERRNNEWDEEDERRQAERAPMKKDDARSTDEEIALQEIAKMDAASNKRNSNKGKGKAAAVPRTSGRRKKVKSGDYVDEEDLADE